MTRGGGGGRLGPWPAPAAHPRVPSGSHLFMGPSTVTRSSLRMLRRVAVFWRPLRLVLLLVSFAGPSGGCAGAVLDVAGCAVCASAAPSSWRIEVVLVVARVV